MYSVSKALWTCTALPWFLLCHQLMSCFHNPTRQILDLLIKSTMIFDMYLTKQHNTKVRLRIHCREHDTAVLMLQCLGAVRHLAVIGVNNTTLWA